MLKFDDKKELQYGVYLFINDAVTLLKHMNGLMGFSASECFKNAKVTTVENYTDDNFF